MKSGITGLATVVFGGAIRIDIGQLVGYEDGVAIGLSELIHPGKTGEEMQDDQTYCDQQVALCFHNLDELNHFRSQLGKIEEIIKENMYNEKKEKQ